MDERNGQGIFIGVTVAVICLSGLLFFFPEPSQESAAPTQAQGQVILPRTSTPSQSGPRSQPKQPSIRSAQKPPANDPNEIWQVIYLGRHRIGYLRTTFETFRDNGRERVRSQTEMQMSFLRYGQVTRTRVRGESIEASNGDLLSFRIQTDNGQNSRRGGSMMTGKVAGTRLLIESTVNGRSERRFLPWSEGIKSPTYQDRLVRASPMKPREIRRFTTFLPDSGRTTEVQLVAGGYRNIADRSGKLQRLLRVRVTRSISPSEVVDVYLDDRGWPVISESDFTDKKLRHYTVSKGEALESIAGAELDLGVSTLIRVPLIAKAHQRKQITYRIYMANGDPARYLPTGPTQRVRPIDERTVELTVSAAEAPRRRVHTRTKPEYLESSQFVQVKDVRVENHARRAAGYDTEPRRIALQMERYVHEKLVNKNFSTTMASAAEVAKNMEGDCTEHAVLLAAMLRARRIPSRIAVGLVYVPRQSSFGAHMWTEAWIHGQWVPLDATLGQGGTGPAHIKLADASFADNSAAPLTAFVPLINVLGRWRIEIRDVK